MTKKKYFYLLIVFIVAIVIVVKVVKQVEQKRHAREQANMAIPVLATYPVERTVSNAITIVGTIVASQETYITPRISGYIAKLFFTEGEQVAAGTPLIQLDDTKIKAQVRSDEITYQIHQRRFALDQVLFKKGLIVKQDMETAQAEMSAAFVTLTQDKQLLDETILRAPFAGYLGARNISVGDYVNIGQQLVLLVDRDHLEVQYNVQEKYAARLKRGQAITVTSQLNPSQSFNATIHYIAPNIDNTSRTIAVHAQVDDPQHQLLPGQYVIIKQPLSEPMQALFIPEQAIIPSLEGDKVYTVLNHQAKSVLVKVGVHQDGLVEVAKGLSLSQQVITEGEERLHDGQTVSIQLTPTKSQ